MWAVKDEDCFSQSCCFNSPPPPTPLTKYIFNIFVIIFVNEKFCILIRISMKFIPKDRIYNSSLLVQIMAWRWPGDKPLFEPMMVNLLTPICVTRSPWVNSLTCRLGDGLQSLISNSQTHIKDIQYIPRNTHTVFALLCFVVVIHWLIFPYPPGLLRWHCGNLTIAPVPAMQPWWIWINTSCEIIINDNITTTKQSTTKPCAYLLGYTVHLKYLLWNCPQMNDTRPHWRLVNTCSGNGMVPTDNMPSPEQI